MEDFAFQLEQIVVEALEDNSPELVAAELESFAEQIRADIEAGAYEE